MTAELRLRDNNPYINGRVTVFEEGDMSLDPSQEETMFKRLTLHIVKQGDEITVLAWQYYKDTVADPAKYWHVIARANDIKNPWDLADLVGQYIRIPDILEYRLSI